jgi:hypothetical protein
MDKHEAMANIVAKLKDADLNKFKGLKSDRRILSLANQMMDSIRRIEFVQSIGKREISPERLNPNSELFDPLKAAVFHYNNKNVDEAIWLVFLATHFGKSESSGWQLCRDIYGMLGYGNTLTWLKITNDFEGFSRWYNQASRMMKTDGVVRKFSNHRKYESLRTDTAKSIPNVFCSYISWIGNGGSHQGRIQEGLHTVGNDTTKLFDHFYKSINKQVLSFGRLATFDFLTMLSKIGLINTYPQVAYLKNSTGPSKGVALLVKDSIGYSSADPLEKHLREFADLMSLGLFEMQILEDSLCNWQKSPDKYIYFRG